MFAQFFHDHFDRDRLYAVPHVVCLHRRCFCIRGTMTSMPEMSFGAIRYAEGTVGSRREREGEREGEGGGKERREGRRRGMKERREEAERSERREERVERQECL